MVPNTFSASCALSPERRKLPDQRISRADSRILICSNMQSHISALWGSCSIIGDMPSKVWMTQIMLCARACDLGTGVASVCGAARTSETQHWFNFLLYFMQQGQSLSPASPPNRKPGAPQAHPPSPTVPIYQRERIILLRETPVNTHFPSVSKIIQLIKHAVLISCLGDQEKPNFIGGWFPSAIPAFYRRLYLCILC